ncbi:MAG: hypothetical protein IIB00_05500 [candidate division Zixibacteria bacterium]|nr:hypothetical protein [candidate division Zixibacteria bacterium]
MKSRAICVGLAVMVVLFCASSVQAWIFDIVVEPANPQPGVVFTILSNGMLPHDCGPSTTSLFQSGDSVVFDISTYGDGCFTVPVPYTLFDSISIAEPGLYTLRIVENYYWGDSTLYFTRDSLIQFVVGDSSDISPCFLCIAGDANASDEVEIGDPIFLVKYIFGGGLEPECMREADANADGEITISDAIFLVRYIFADGPSSVCSPE